MFLLCLLLSLFVPQVIAKPKPSISWEKMIAKSSPGIVSIRVAANRHFDTNGTSVSVATGFVVDKEKGIILTNRHVVQPGPVTAHAVFLNNEEVPIQPIYRDPVHDFGFYRFDPKKIKHMEVPELSLCADCARMGVQVRLIGNDAGEKISILPGTLARMDRNSPNYGFGRYNDFNTFYIQAAAGTSGGSSGSPVLDINGKVVALNAGGKMIAASSFFLPLYRVERALQLIQSGKRVTRGTLQTHFSHQPYDAAMRLGLRSNSIAAIRRAFPQQTGLLIVKRVNPSGPAYGKLKNGDVLLQLNGKWISEFVPLEKVLDESVGKQITILVERGGKPISVKMNVQDLHSITPDSFVELCGGVVHQLSYQIARHYSVPVQGIYVALPGYCLGEGQLRRNHIITAINGQAIKSLDDFWSKLIQLPTTAKVQVDYFALKEKKRIQQAIVPWDRKWFPMAKWQRNDKTGMWDKTMAPKASDEKKIEVSSTQHPKWSKKIERKLSSTLVTVDFKIPYRVEGVYGDKFRGTGIILDVNKGIVAVDRDTVPIALGDVSVVFAGDLRVNAEVVWLHPEHNVALVKYDPKLIGDTPVQAAKLLDRTPKAGEGLYIVGRNYDHEMVSKKTVTTELVDITGGRPRIPFFMESNISVIDVESAPSTVGGVVADKCGRILGMWASFVLNRSGKKDYEKFALPSYVLQESLDSYEKDELKVLGVFFDFMSIIEARDFGLTDNQSTDLAKLDPRLRILRVQRVSSLSAAKDKLKIGDIILKLNGKATISLREIEESVRNGKVSFQVLRSGKVIEVTIKPTVRKGQGVRKVLSFGGALIHDVPIAVPDYWASSRKGAYISWCARGAPCSRDSFRPTNRILAVNEKPVNNMDELVEHLKSIDLSKPIRFSLLDLRGIPNTIPLRSDLRYWPTAWIEYKDNKWSYTPWK